MSKESWYSGKINDMDIIRIDIGEGFIVDYDKSRGMYRVSVFDDGHFWDEFWFDAYEDKEVDDRIEKIIQKLELVKKDFNEHLNKYNRSVSANGMEHFLNRLIEWIKELD